MAGKDEKEWFLQAESTLDAAETLFRGGKYVFAVFMCHLAVEKALKAVHCAKNKKDPPRTHDLVFLAKAVETELPGELHFFIEGLSSLSVQTRYPEDLKRISREYDGVRTRDIMNNCKDVLKCLKPLLNKK